MLGGLSSHTAACRHGPIRARLGVKVCLCAVWRVLMWESRAVGCMYVSGVWGGLLSRAMVLLDGSEARWRAAIGP